MIFILFLRLSFSPQSINFGYGEKGREYNYIIKITNDWVDTAYIKKIFSSCGCTGVKVPSKKIPPRGSVPLLFTFRFYKRFPDNVEKYIYMYDRGMHFYSFVFYMHSGKNPPVEMIQHNENIEFVNKTSRKLKLKLLPPFGFDVKNNISISPNSKRNLKFKWNIDGYVSFYYLNKIALPVEINGERYIFNIKVGSGRSN